MTRHFLLLLSSAAAGSTEDPSLLQRTRNKELGSAGDSQETAALLLKTSHQNENSVWQATDTLEVLSEASRKATVLGTHSIQSGTLFAADSEVCVRNNGDTECGTAGSEGDIDYNFAKLDGQEAWVMTSTVEYLSSGSEEVVACTRLNSDDDYEVRYLPSSSVQAESGLYQLLEGSTGIGQNLLKSKDTNDKDLVRYIPWGGSVPGVLGKSWFRVLVPKTLPMDSVEIELIDRFQGDERLRAKFLRLGFHDCVGGCDGCVDLTDADNSGLEYPIEVLNEVLDKFSTSGFSRADLYAFATLIASREAQSGSEGDEDWVGFSFDAYGRVDCEDVNCQGDACVPEKGGTAATQGPVRHLPSPYLDSDGVFLYFEEEFGFNENETVAIMGAHSIGGALRNQSGFNGSWVSNERQLNNGYYSVLVASQSNENGLEHITDWFMNTVDNSDINGPIRMQWIHTKGLTDTIGIAKREEEGREVVDGAEQTMMLDTDIALVRNFSITRDGNLGTFLDAETGEVSCAWRCLENDECEVSSAEDCDDEDELETTACRACRCFDGRREARGELPVCGSASTIFIASEYQNSNAVWIHAFEVALKKMLMHGYSSLSALSA